MENIMCERLRYIFIETTMVFGIRFRW